MQKYAFALDPSFAEVAQLVEHLSEEQRVGGSSPPLSTGTQKAPKGAFSVYLC